MAAALCGWFCTDDWLHPRIASFVTVLWRLVASTDGRYDSGVAASSCGGVQVTSDDVSYRPELSWPPWMNCGLLTTKNNLLFEHAQVRTLSHQVIIVRSLLAAAQ
jgi:hypothetical protein